MGEILSRQTRLKADRQQFDCRSVKPASHYLGRIEKHHTKWRIWLQEIPGTDSLLVGQARNIMDQ